MVVNIPAFSPIYQLGAVPSPMHIYNQGGAQTHYDLTIINVGVWLNVAIQPGHTDTYRPDNNPVFIRNNGPSKLQVLYYPPEEAVAPSEAGWDEVAEFPPANVDEPE